MDKYRLISTDGEKEDEEEDEQEQEEDDFHMKTFLEMADGLEKIKRIGLDGVAGKAAPSRSDDGSAFITDTPPATVVKRLPTVGDNTLCVTTHASVMYYGDRLALSTETVQLTMSVTDHDMFCRVVKCFTDMLMGTYTNDDLRNLRHDHDELLKRWDVCGVDDTYLAANDASSQRAIGDEIHKMIKNMLETPVYYTSSCMALIACGVMLRDLFKTTVGREAMDFEELLRFIRERMRHNSAYPFACDCPPTNKCSASYKTLLSLILEVPPIVHNQTYMLQILAYLMYNKEGREEIFVVNMKNIVSPGLLDKVPTRMAMLIGSLDEREIKTTTKRLRHEVPLSTIVGGGAGGGGASKTRTNTYGRPTLENIIMAVHDPRIVRLINTLPGVENATVELVLERCKNRRACVNADNASDVRSPKDNNYGKNRCCGYLKLDPASMLVSSISLVQLCVYLYTDTRQAHPPSKRHYFVRDILLTMAKCSMNVDETCLEDIFGYLDRCDVFKGFAQNPLFTSTFYKLFQTYLKSMKKVAENYKTKRRKMHRLLEKIQGCPM